ncbi:1,4-dihydroxy-2-naphthoate octaprenyltransferase [Capnocytophaga sp. ARDL2]|uniref:1,4-dihydroxy-2-naphthoate octaprenyltransferase n=1 Tax=Capnocytophaga sp. ARDL2 TaxID=3238809 RepID=UPI0035568436
MKIAIIITSVLSLISSVLVIYYSFGYEDLFKVILYLLLAISCVGAAIKYTVGNSAYGYRGLGDVFVFLFFGWVGTIATYYLYSHTIDWLLFLPATSLGLFSTAVLNMNNMRDVENDAQMNKNTLVVKMGFEKAKLYQYSLIFAGMFSFFIFGALTFNKVWQFLMFLLFIPFFQHIDKVKNTQIPRELDSELKKIAMTTFFISLAYFITQIL